jgi:hypothetical protein
MQGTGPISIRHTDAVSNGRLLGSTDGVNRVFLTSQSGILSSIEVSYNGVRLSENDYSITISSQIQITLNFTPLVETDISVSYQR